MNGTDTDTCNVDGCETEVYSRGLCKRHYMQNYRDKKNGKDVIRHADVIEDPNNGAIDLSDHKEEIIRLRVEEGWSTHQLADEYDVSERTIRRRLKTWRVYKSRKSQGGLLLDLSDHKDEIIRLRVEEGYTVYQLADEYDVAENTIRHRLQDWGVYESRSHYRDVDLSEHKDEIIKLRTEEGWSTYQLADEYDVDRKTIENRLKSWGVYAPLSEHTDRTTFVYLMQTDTSNLGYSKIGVSWIPNNRVKDINNMGRGTLDWVVKDSFKFDTRSEAYAMEKSLHEVNAQHNVAGEFFRVPVDELDLEPLREERIIQDRTVQEEFEMQGLEPEPVLELAA